MYGEVRAIQYAYAAYTQVVLSQWRMTDMG